MSINLLLIYIALTVVVVGGAACFVLLMGRGIGDPGECFKALRRRPRFLSPGSEPWRLLGIKPFIKRPLGSHWAVIFHCAGFHGTP